MTQKLWSQYHNLLPALSVFVILVMLSQEKNCKHLTFVAISRCWVRCKLWTTWLRPRATTPTFTSRYTENPYTAASIVQTDDTKGFNSPVWKFEILNNFTGKTDLSSKWWECYYACAKGFEFELRLAKTARTVSQKYRHPQFLAPPFQCS